MIILICIVMLLLTIIIISLTVCVVVLKKDVSEGKSKLDRLIAFVDDVVKFLKTTQEDKKMKKLFYYPVSNDLKRAHTTDAGMDIMSAEEYVLKPHERHLFSTGIYGVLPKGTGVIVKPRSGLAVKFGIDVLAGVVDEGYTGEIKVLLVNHGSEDFKVEVGDKIAQLLLMDVYQTSPEKISQAMFNVFKTNKDRLDKGFGSSGVKGDKDGKDKG